LADDGNLAKVLGAVGVSPPSKAKPKAKAKPAAKPKAKPKSKASADSLTPQENAIFNQMHRDIGEEGKASPSQLKGLIKQVTADQAEEGALTGLSHPDAQQLLKAGIPESKVKALTQKYAPSHPAAAPSAGYSQATKGANAGTGVTANPTDPSQYAADVLTEAGLPDTASNEKLLEDQMTVEGMPGSEDNPLATSEPEAGSSTVNSAGVQEYPTLAEGAQAEAQTLDQPNMKSIYNALLSGTATPNQYATGLAASSYEGSNPAANAAYATSFLQDAGQPTTNFPGGSASSGYDSGLQGLVDSGASQALTDQAASTSTGAGLSIPTLGTSMSNSSLQSALAGLSDPASAQTLAANTSNAPGNPDQTPSQAQQTSVPSAAQYQQALAALIPGIRPGASNG